MKKVLQYEQAVLNREKRAEILNADRAIRCTHCGSLFFSILDGEKEKPDTFCPGCVLNFERKRVRRFLKALKLMEAIFQIELDPTDADFTDEMRDDLFDEEEDIFEVNKKKELDS
jgi:DNA-directed RNA polymerase subunit RPC12/RpoP